MTNPVNVITIDGPSGTGKGTISLLLAKQLGWHYLDSGSLYRVLAHVVLAQDLDPTDGEKLAKIASELLVSYEMNTDGTLCHVMLAGQDISEAIRSEATSAMSSKVSAHPEVRNALITLQKSFAKAPGLVTDGRDMGTIIFPQAQLKVFMTASSEVRAQRRYDQLKNKGIDANLAAVQQQLEQRDKRDRERAVAPCVPADDAVVIDTSAQTIDNVLQQILDLVAQRELATAV